MSAPLQFPQFDPVIFHLGPLAIRWYALAYIVGLVTGWQVMRRLVLGGRLGYVLFYQPAYYLHNPLQIPAVWTGGMSFHGGMLGVVVALIVFCRLNGIPLLGFADRMGVVTPIGLGLGRVANFINGELWGRPAPDWLPWRMIFPRADDVPRHPSQLYQALMEGLLLFVLMWVLSRREWIRARFGMLTGIFLIGYGIARIIGEFFREPDAFLGYLWQGATMGQILSIPMILAGLGLVAYSRRSRVGVGA
jgi:phosphatidylglycerol:prolipoprotein diacylglycerol transferase